MSLPLNIAVFGGSGFLGRALIQSLARQGHRIRVPVREQTPQPPWSLMGLPDQICPFSYNPRQDSSVVEAVAGMDVVINLIGILAEKGPHQTFQNAHVETAARIARLAKEAGVAQLLHVSALGASLQAKARYARSKAVGEEAVRAFFPEAVIFRPSVIFGAGDQFLTRFARMARFSPVLPLIGGGKTLFQPVFVGDVAGAITRAIQDRHAAGRTYLLGGPQIYSFRTLLSLVMATLGRPSHFLSIPWELAPLCAWMAEHLPDAPLTRDQVKLLRQDNIIESADKDPIGTNRQSGHWTLADLDITPQRLELILPDLIGGFRSASPSA